MSEYKNPCQERDLKRPTLIAVIGSTAVGKTELSLELARQLKAEIISVDSRQVYRYLDVGTDKVSTEIRREIPHHLIDIVDPDQVFSAADFVTCARKAVEDIFTRGKNVLLVGGTALFYKALEGGMLTECLPKNEAIRSELEQEVSQRGGAWLHSELERIDPCSAKRLHPNDHVRIIRAIEIFRVMGRTATECYQEDRKQPSPYLIQYLGLSRPRDQLYEKIAKRVRQQFASGYYEEVCHLLKRYDPTLPALCGFGYKELVAYHEGEMTFEEAIKGDIRATKLYSRRQNTWFKHFSPVTWYDLSEGVPEEIFSQLLKKAQEALMRFR